MPWTETRSQESRYSNVFLIASLFSLLNVSSDLPIEFLPVPGKKFSCSDEFVTPFLAIPSSLKSSNLGTSFRKGPLPVSSYAEKFQVPASIAWLQDFESEFCRVLVKKLLIANKSFERNCLGSSCREWDEKRSDLDNCRAKKLPSDGYRLLEGWAAEVAQGTLAAARRVEEPGRQFAGYRALLADNTSSLELMPIAVDIVLVPRGTENQLRVDLLNVAAIF